MKIYPLLFLILLPAFTVSLVALNGVVVGSDDQFIEAQVQILMQAILNDDVRSSVYCDVCTAVSAKAELDFPDALLNMKDQRVGDLVRILMLFNDKVEALHSPLRHRAFVPLAVCRRYIELYIGSFMRKAAL